MSKTHRQNDLHRKSSESRAHSEHHRFDGHKLANGVNSNFARRVVMPPSIMRSGRRGK